MQFCFHESIASATKAEFHTAGTTTFATISASTLAQCDPAPNEGITEPSNSSTRREALANDYIAAEHPKTEWACYQSTSSLSRYHLLST